MSDMFWDEVARRIDQHGYMGEIERTMARVRSTGEVFTPTPLVIQIVRRIPLERFAPGLLVLDPACGDGQFLAAAKWIKVLHYDLPEVAALRDLFGVDIMRDNVDLCRRRLGGGSIVHGDILHPERELQGQTDEDRTLMRRLFTGRQLRLDGIEMSNVAPRVA